MVYIYAEGVGNSFACALGIFVKKRIGNVVLRHYNLVLANSEIKEYGPSA